MALFLNFPMVGLYRYLKTKFPKPGNTWFTLLDVNKFHFCCAFCYSLMTSSPELMLPPVKEVLFTSINTSQEYSLNTYILFHYFWPKQSNFFTTGCNNTWSVNMIYIFKYIYCSKIVEQWVNCSKKRHRSIIYCKSAKNKFQC